VQSHYRYYQFACNMLLAVVWSYSINRFLRTTPSLGLGTDLGMVLLVVVLFAASRDKVCQETTSAEWRGRCKAFNILGGERVFAASEATLWLAFAFVWRCAGSVAGPNRE